MFSEPTAKPESDAPTPTSVPEPPKVESTPEPTTSAPLTDDTDLVNLVLGELPKGEIFTAKMIRSALEKHCGNRANEIGRLLFPVKIVRLGMTNQFVFRDNDLRPASFKGLCDPNLDGVIPETPEPF